MGWLFSLDTVGHWGTCVTMLETLQDHAPSHFLIRVAVTYALPCCRTPVLRQCWRGEPGRHRDRRAQQCPKRPMAAHPTRALTRRWCTPPRNTFQPAAPQSRWRPAHLILPGSLHGLIQRALKAQASSQEYCDISPLPYIAVCVFLEGSTCERFYQHVTIWTCRGVLIGAQSLLMTGDWRGA